MEPINGNTHMKNIGAKVDVTKINELVGDSDSFRVRPGSGCSRTDSLQHRNTGKLKGVVLRAR